MAVVPVMTGLRARAETRCGRTLRWKLRNMTLTCERVGGHPGCHLDLTRSCWFDRRQDKTWLIAPRGERIHYV